MHRAIADHGQKFRPVAHPATSVIELEEQFKKWIFARDAWSAIPIYDHGRHHQVPSAMEVKLTFRPVDGPALGRIEGVFER